MIWCKRIFVLAIAFARLHIAAATNEVVATVRTAETPAVARQTNDLTVVRAALRDGLWDVARRHLGAATTTESRLLLLESYAGEGRWKDVERELTRFTDEKGSAFDYYRAIVRGDHEKAMAILRAGGSDEGIVEAQMYEALQLDRTGRRTDAEAIWRDLIVRTNVSARAFVYACVNLNEPKLLRQAVERADSSALRCLAGLRLGRALLQDDATVDEGEKIVRTIVKDFPDAEGAMEAFVAIADAELRGGHWREATVTYHEAVETWPAAAKLERLQEGRALALQRQGHLEEALETFARAESLADDDDVRAAVRVKIGDVLSELGRDEEAMAKYRDVLTAYPKSSVSKRLAQLVAVRELEATGRDQYRHFQFADARKFFAQVAAKDTSRAMRMAYFDILCLYGLGKSAEASNKARALSEKCSDKAVQLDATLWLAKYLFNSAEWKQSNALFLTYAEGMNDPNAAADAWAWAARAALAGNDFNGAIRAVAALVKHAPSSPVRPQAQIVQAEALIELARFDEAVLVLERAILATSITPTDRLRAQILKADALYAMGADNSHRYVQALETYRAILLDTTLSRSDQLPIAFKIARTLEKLRQIDEAVDQYYSQVVLAYISGREKGDRFDDEARAAFSRAAFRLADEFESRGNEQQVLHILRLVVASDVPAATEAQKRIDRISLKGRFL